MCNTTGILEVLQASRMCGIDPKGRREEPKGISREQGELANYYTRLGTITYTALTCEHHSGKSRSDYSHSEVDYGPLQAHVPLFADFELRGYLLDDTSIIILRIRRWYIVVSEYSTLLVVIRSTRCAIYTNHDAVLL